MNRCYFLFRYVKKLLRLNQHNGIDTTLCERSYLPTTMKNSGKLSQLKLYNIFES